MLKAVQIFSQEHCPLRFVRRPLGIFPACGQKACLYSASTDGWRRDRVNAAPKRLAFPPSLPAQQHPVTKATPIEAADIERFPDWIPSPEA